MKSLLILLFLPLLGYSQYFKVILPQTDASFRGLSVVDESIAWVSGTKGWVGRSTDGGNTWNYKQVTGFEKADFRTLYAFDDKTAIIANAGSPAFILYTSDAGNNWTVVYKNEDTAAFFDGIDFWNDKDGIIYGDPIAGRMLFLRTNDGGKSWQEFPRSERPVLEEGEASFAASGSCIKCMKDGKLVIATGGKVSRLWVSEDKGRNWTTVVTPILQGGSSRGIFSFAFRDKKHAVIVGGDYKIDSLASANMFYTEDGGKHWQAPQLSTRGYRESVVYMDKYTLIAVGPSGIDISNNGGNTWQPLSDDKKYHVIKKARKGQAIIIAGGEGKVAVLTKRIIRPVIR